MNISKKDIRKQLETGMAVFLSQGKEIKKFETKSKRSFKPKEEVVEIEVEHLPKALQNKYFGE